MRLVILWFLCGLLNLCFVVSIWLLNVCSFHYIYNFRRSSSSRPAIRFSSDETVACRMATNEIQFFDAKDFSKGVVYRLRVPGVTAIELSRTPGTHIAAFVPESKVGPSLMSSAHGD